MHDTCLLPLLLLLARGPCRTPTTQSPRAGAHIICFALVETSDPTGLV
jgi:hypothetical protein